MNTQLIISLVVLAYFGFISIIDIRKSNVIPSVYTTTPLVIFSLVNPGSIGFGITAFLFGLLLMEIGLYQGMADVKMMGLIGLLVFDVNTLIFAFFLFAFYNLVYQVIVKKVFKLKHKDEIPFLPIFFFVYLTLTIVTQLA